MRIATRQSKGRHYYCPAVALPLQDCFFTGHGAIIRGPMTETKHPVVRLLNTPGIAQVVPNIPVEALHRLIDSCGLDACVEVVALATPLQLRRVLDIDLWRAPAPGKDEVFDPGRFAAWLETLMQAGAETAAAVLRKMDFDLVVGGLTDHVSVFDGAAVAPYTSLDGERREGRAFTSGQVSEIGGFVVEGRSSSAWDAIVDLLVHLHDDERPFFAALMRGCVELSDGAREPDGFHALEDRRGQHRLDLGGERESRREGEGYVAAAQARAFLQTARATRPEGERPPPDPIAHASLRDVAKESASGDDGVEARGVSSARDVPAEPSAEAAVMEILCDAGVIATPRALLPAGRADESRLALVRGFAELHLPAGEELAFLANAVLAGCGIAGRPFTPPEASDLVLATCNLGLENWPPAWANRDMVTAFQIGWGLLHRDLCCHGAAVLAETLAVMECNDGDTQSSLEVLRRELIRHGRDGEPWRARDALDAILVLDALSWAVLRALVDECPTVHPALTMPRTMRIDPEGFTFVARNDEIARAREWLASLPAALAG